MWANYSTDHKNFTGHMFNIKLEEYPDKVSFKALPIKIQGSKKQLGEAHCCPSRANRVQVLSDKVFLRAISDRIIFRVFSERILFRALSDRVLSRLFSLLFLICNDFYNKNTLLFFINESCRKTGKYKYILENLKTYFTKFLI